MIGQYDRSSNMSSGRVIRMRIVALLLVQYSFNVVFGLATPSFIVARGQASPRRMTSSSLLVAAPTKTIEKDETDTSSKKVAERTPSKSKQRSARPDIDDINIWELRLYNDEANFEFWVAEQLVKIAGLTERQAFDTMKLADATGEATIASYECFELAEYYHEALNAEGLAVKLLPIQL